MNKSRNIVLLCALMIATVWAVTEMRIHANSGGIGTDVIVGDMPGITRWGSDSVATSFSVGTTSCNIGDEELSWISNTNQHPVISQNLFRVKDGRIEQLGQSWLKHGFFALSQSLCGTCQATNGSALGVGCSDPYTSGLNGSQNGLGPKSQVDASTGFFPYPHRALTSSERGTFGGRIRVLHTDLDSTQNPGARYFISSQYVHPDDAANGNDNNNESYRETFVSGSNGNFDLDLFSSSPTVRTEPAIHAWRAVYPDVKLFNVDIPGDGRIIVGIRTTPDGNGFHHEIAMENLTSHQSVGSLAVIVGSGSISNPGFRDVDYHAEDYSDVDWAPAPNGSEMEWSSETFAENEDANALRWGTLYSCWCDSDSRPTQLTLGLFRPGALSEVTVELASTVATDSVETTQGTYMEGGIEELELSDNADLVIQRSSTDTLSRTEFEVTGTSPTASPTLLEVTLEGSVFARTQVIQTIELFDYDAASWVLVDSRDASQFSDSTVTVAAPGDLSRFVESGTNSVEARVLFQSPVNRQQFVSRTDQFIWTIGN